MNSRAGNSFGTHQQRGFWLRCFLDRATWPLLFLLLSGPASAQLDIPGPVHLTHVEGQVVNSAGQPVANLEVTLNRDNKVAFRTSTSQSGEFRFEHVSGRFTFRVARSEYAPAVREIVVTDEIATRVERKRLYVILGPGACMDECFQVLTNKHDFDREIREKNNR